MQLFDQPHVDVTISLKIWDVRIFVRAARKHAIEHDGYTPEDAKREFRATTLGDCAVMLLDPGASPPGCTILESSTETF